ncbi:hypothetical protein EWM64_g9092 [Hericium alpestre]|uniref:Uncharacterized protein n=1 Tax=Hericium alpestre TaxID=135208 RepID=A0A4Y9ZL05_9AGAM|nr:hypothetical protein EWM64_g9092 [Hericium alpestre]
MIGESGAIYSTSLIVVLILDYVAPAYCTIAYPAMEQIMGIAPTLIMVRVGLGKSFETWRYEDLSAIVAPACRPVHFTANNALSLTSVRVANRDPSRRVSAPTLGS